jgi:K+-sensing histidine kinase KdpD
MHQEEQPGLADIDFPTIMAVAVHDMKNSLSLLMQSVEQLSNELPEKEKQAREHLADVHYEASRMNTTLVQVLSLYRADMDALPTNIDECFVEELIEELVDTNLSFTKQRKIDVEVDVDEDMSWYLDKVLKMNTLLSAQKTMVQVILIACFK